MTKTELENAIKNGESVWVVDEEENKIEELHFYKNNIYEFDKNDLFINKFWIYEFRKLFKTKAEAEHYLNHTNITRTEQLPFLTWEEFLDKKELFFTNKSGYPMCLCVVDTRLSKKIGLGGANGYFDLQQTWDLTEANFYKAYDECVRLFKGGEQL